MKKFVDNILPRVLELYMSNYSLFKKLWFLFFESCVQQFTFATSFEILAAGIDKLDYCKH